MFLFINRHGQWWFEKKEEFRRHSGMHLLLTNVLHWSIQRKNSISKMVRAMRENINDCLLFINENPLIRKFFEELKKICQT